MDRNGYKDMLKTAKSALTDRPLVVLVDDKTAAGAEILVAALQENGRGKIVGETTCGSSAPLEGINQFEDGSQLIIAR